MYSTSSSPELRAQENAVAITSKEHKLLNTLHKRARQGLSALLSKVLGFPFMPLEIPEKEELAELNLFPRAFRNNGNSFQPRGKEDAF